MSEAEEAGPNDLVLSVLLRLELNKADLSLVFSSETSLFLSSFLVNSSSGRYHFLLSFSSSKLELVLPLLSEPERPQG